MGLPEQYKNDSQNNTKPISEAATGDINTQLHLCSWSPRIKAQNQEDELSRLKKLELRHWNTDVQMTDIFISCLPAETDTKRRKWPPPPFHLLYLGTSTSNWKNLFHIQSCSCKGLLEK